MTENTYLLLVSKKGKTLKPLKKQFQELGGFYNGIGYAFPKKGEAAIKEIADSINEKIHEMPLGNGQTFESMQQGHKSLFFREKLIEHESELLKYKADFNLNKISEETIQTSTATDYKKEAAIDLLHECERLEGAVVWAEGMEKAISIPPNTSIQIKFINEGEKNFLLNDPPQMPRLVNFIDENGTPRPFIRKGITGMLVGAGGSGKTHWLTTLGLSIASGRKFLGKYPIEKPGHVFIGLGENADEDIHRLLRKTFTKLFHISPQMDFEEKQELEAISSRLAVMSFTGMQSSFIHNGIHTGIFESLLSQLQKREPDEGWSCIILDPISRFLGADAETDNAAATAFIATIERLTLELKGHPTILFGHHMNKSGISGTNTDQAAARGSSALTDGVRLQINLEKVKGEDGENKINMKMVKSNFTAILPDQILIKDALGCLSLDVPTSNEQQPIAKVNAGKYDDLIPS